MNCRDTKKSLTFRFSVDNFELLVEKVEELPTLYSVDMVNMDTCRNQLLLEDIRQYGREI